MSGNFLAECGSGVQLTGLGQASKVTDNLIGAGFVGLSIFAEGHMGLLVTGNNVFPRGRSSVHFKNCTRSTITANRFHAFYPGMVNFEGSCTENLVASNHFLRQMEPLDPLKPYSNGLGDLFGLVHVAGSNNAVTGNHFSYDVPAASVNPPTQPPTIVLVASGSNNFIATNNTVASVPVRTVVLDGATSGTKVLDCGTPSEFQAHGSPHSFRPTP